MKVGWIQYVLYSSMPFLIIPLATNALRFAEISFGEARGSPNFFELWKVLPHSFVRTDDTSLFTVIGLSFQAILPFTRQLRRSPLMDHVKQHTR